MARYGLKVSKPGYDVKTAADENLLLTTELPNYKVYSSGTFSLTTNGSGEGTAFITHDLGYAPLNVITIQNSVGGNYRRLNTFFIADQLTYTYTIGTSNIEIRSSTLGSAQLNSTFYGYYYIFYDPSNG